MVCIRFYTLPQLVEDKPIPKLCLVQNRLKVLFKVRVKLVSYLSHVNIIKNILRSSSHFLTIE